MDDNSPYTAPLAALTPLGISTRPDRLFLAFNASLAAGGLFIVCTLITMITERSLFDSSLYSMALTTLFFAGKLGLIITTGLLAKKNGRSWIGWGAAVLLSGIFAYLIVPVFIHKWTWHVADDATAQDA